MAFEAAAEEMHYNLLRSAHSTIVRESRDAATALFDADGMLLAQGKHTIPMLLNAFPSVMAGFRAQGLLRDLRPGDALVSNDPYAGGQHLDDIAVVVPVFFSSGLVGFSGSMAHHLDLGASEPGLSPMARTVFEEGIRLRPMRIDLDRDLRPGGVLYELLAANIRVPDQTLGDLDAQVAAVKTGRRRMVALFERYGPATVLAGMRAQLDYADLMMRTAIRETPDGRYEAEESLDTSAGVARIRVQVTVVGDTVELDLTGTDAQVDGPVNSPLASTVSAVQTAVQTLLLPDGVAINDGARRALRVTVPGGTLLNPRFPAAVGARMGACFKVFDAIMNAMSGPMPDRVITASYSSVAAVALTYSSASGYRIFREALGGGYGAGADYPGADAVAITLTNTANVPVELTEQTFGAFIVESYRVRPGSGGPGCHRGGNGVEKSYRMLTGGVQFAGYSDHHTVPPAGMAGGGPGRTAEFAVSRGGTEFTLPPLAIASLQKGDLLTIRTAGGGGFGRPRGESRA
jgi:N-methylhydantoinase B